MLNAITEVMSRFAAVHYLVIAANLLLMLLARSLILKTGGKLTERQIDFRVNVLRVLNLAILMAVCYNAFYSCLLYTSPSPRDRTRSRMPSSA